MKRLILLTLSTLCIIYQLHAYENLKFHTLSNKGGLSYDGIVDIKQDGQGLIWILLGTNLFRFDGYSYKSFKDYILKKEDPLLGYFNNLAIDKNGDIIVSSSHGGFKYDYRTDSFHKIIDRPLNFILVDAKNRLWHKSENELYYLEQDENNRENKPPRQIHFEGDKKPILKNIICKSDNDNYFFSQYGKIYRYNEVHDHAEEWANLEKEFENGYLVDASIVNDELWLLTNKFRILKIDLHTKKITYTYKHHSFKNLNIRKLYISNNGEAWVGTMNGLYIVDPKTDTVYLHQSKDDEVFSLPNNSVWTINEDNKKNIWIGTYTGALVYVNMNEEKIFESFHMESGGLNMVPVSGFNEVDKFIWISTEGGGINIFDKQTSLFTPLQETNTRNTISSNNTKSSVTDSDGNIWIPTFRGGLNGYNPTTKHFTHFKEEANNKNALYSNNLRKIILEPDSGLWIIYLQHTASFSFFSFKESQFTHYSIDMGKERSMNYDYIYDAYRDGVGRLWLTTSFSLFSLDVASKELREYPFPSKNNPASTICVDEEGIVWIGTFGNELIRFDSKTESFVSLRDILQSNIAEIYSINHSLNRDGERIIWMGTNDGLYMYNTITGSSVVYKESDGTQGDVYYPLSTYKDKEGLLYFGGTGGFTIINPEKVILNPQKPKAIISDFYIDNQSILNDNLIKTLDIKNLSEIRLSHTQQNFGFQLSSDNYLNADKNLFRYRLKNYDDRWIETNASNRIVLYSKIPAGKYILELQAANNDGIWGDISSSVIIRRQAPWLTLPARILYFLLFSLLVYYFYSTYRKRKELELQLYRDKLENEKNEEIHRNQLQFFTNISHDLKTPLSLIMITINKMREEGMREFYYKILNNNAERLLRMLNDLLDFRKIQHNMALLHVSKDNLALFIQTLASDFQDYATYKEINYQIVTDDEVLKEIPFDKKVMEKIVMNLLINAFKYTRRGDSISIIAGSKEFTSKYKYSYSVGKENIEGKHTVSIIIRDTGIGITEKSISKVFDRFYQAEPDSRHNRMGTGIGLALVKNLVLLHKGCITIYSEEEVGSDFVVHLPALIDDYAPEDIHDDNTPMIEEKPHSVKSYIESFDQNYQDRGLKGVLGEEVSLEDYDKEKVILLAEDNIALRSIIKSSLKQKYDVIDFDDGKPALEYLKSNNVDLIISDIMMKEMDGISFCKSVKSNMATSHIPFIMLTAKSGLESMLEGTESGADLYFEKPIELTLLKTAIGNIFKQQEVLREYYATNYFAEVSSVSQNKQDNLFLKEVTEIIDMHLDQSDLDVNTIASKMMMSRSKLYAKIKTLTGKSVVEFILSYRLRRAAKLLIENNMSIQQAMFSVGIESQSYFTRAFKKEFEMTPSKFVQKFREGATNPITDAEDMEQKTGEGKENNSTEES